MKDTEAERDKAQAETTEPGSIDSKTALGFHTNLRNDITKRLQDICSALTHMPKIGLQKLHIKSQRASAGS